MIIKENIPKHIALVMDGNGRWAEKRKLPRLTGHNSGMLAMKEIVKKCSALGVEHLTVYAFSTENWKRTIEEVNGIFKLLIIYVEKELRELHENNVKVNVLGEFELLPKDAVLSLKKSLETTKNNDGMQFNIALNYGSRSEIVRAVQNIAKDVLAGNLKADKITNETVSSYLYTEGIPDPELVIRTSGEQRLSNYLLWQSAYSEFVFTDTLWPDFSPEELEKSIEIYQNRNRRFGGRK